MAAVVVKSTMIHPRTTRVKYLGHRGTPLFGATEFVAAGLGVLLVIGFGHVRLRLFHFRRSTVSRPFRLNNPA
jgi:hypothetical protein